MKKVLKPIIAVAVLATVTFAANNVENPLYAPAQLGFYSKTGIGWMYKKSDDNLAMQAKNWANETENPIPRITEDFGFGLTNWLAIRGMFGYTYDGDIERSGMHQARLGLNIRPTTIASTEAFVWDIYADAFLGGISEMKAEIVPSSTNDADILKKQPLSFNYENYGNGRWGVWFGTQIGKTFDKYTISVYGEAERTFANDNNKITVSEGAKKYIENNVYNQVRPGVYEKVYSVALGKAIDGVCEQKSIPQAACNKETLGEPTFSAIETGAKNYLQSKEDDLQKTTTDMSQGIAKEFADGLPESFSVKTKSTWEYAAGLKTLYEINSNWSIGNGFNWKHRATNSIEKVNITNASENPDETTVSAITKGIADTFIGSMKDGVDEFAFSLFVSRQFSDNLQVTLYGEYTADDSEEKAQLGTNVKTELGLRMNLQF